MLNVQTNKVDIKIKYQNLHEDFKILSKSIQYKSFKERGKLINDFKKDINPLAFTITKDEIIYIVNKNDLIKDDMSKKVPMFKIESFPKDFIANLLFQFLREKLNFFSIIEEPYKLFYLVKNGKKILETLCFEIDKNSLFQANAVAFKKFEGDAKESKNILYTTNGKALTIYKEDQKSKDLFSKGNFRNKKITIEFFSRSINQYPNSKAYFIAMFLIDIKKHLSHYIDISFTRELMTSYKSYTNSYKEKKANITLKNIQSSIAELNILNCTKYSTDTLMTSIKKVFDDKIEISLDKPIEKNEFNLVLLYSKEYYTKNNIEDPYKNLKKLNPYTQVLILDNKKINNYSLEVCLKELLIKNDINNKKITLSTYESNQIHKIYSIEAIKNKDTIYKVHELSIEKHQAISYKILEQEEAEEFIQYFLNTNNSDHALEVLVEDFEGNINAIYKTKQYPIVDFEGIYDYYNTVDVEIEKFNPARKGKEDSKEHSKRYHLTQGFHNLKYYLSESKAYYTVGVNVGTNNFSKTAPIRKVCAYKGDLILDKILPTLDEFFVKNKEFTVLPFGLKYLREFRQIIKGGSCFVPLSRNT
ncbi:MAG: hypothetical protein WC141_01575 [Arcobacteraceae bacterium]